MSQSHAYVDDGGLYCALDHCGQVEGHPWHVKATPPLPATPYAGTSGWSGAQSSRERAESEDRGGVTSARQQAVLALLCGRGEAGATWREVASLKGWHHGQASGALSTLHKEGHIARLAGDRRDRCSVYVMPEHVANRETVAQGRSALDPDVVRVERVEWRLVRADGEVVPCVTTDETSTLYHAQVLGHTPQSRTVITIETPWVTPWVTP